MKPKYYHTNESLTAMMKGLEPCSRDRILSIAGSGDQAFALLENAGLVVAADSNEAQLHYMAKRTQDLRKKRFKRFLTYKLPMNSRRMRRVRSYFEAPERLERIRDNLENLILLQPADIFYIAKHVEGFNKIYLSNAVGYDNGGEYENVEGLLRDVSENLPFNGLVYLVVDRCKWKKMNNHFQSVSQLRIDRKRTERAGENAKFWVPVVYRKAEIKRTVLI